MKKSLKPVLIYLPFHIAAVVFTWRDINRRPAERIRGRKGIWKLASAANTVGAASYWLVGRQ